MRKKNVKLWNHLTRELNDFQVQAGWFENSRYDDGTPIAGVAAIQNYGAQINVTEKMRKFLHYMGLHLKNTTGEVVIPPRPFMDNAKAVIKGSEGQRILQQELLRVFEGRQTMEQAVNRLGLWLQGVIQEEIKKMNSPALSGATLEMRENQYDSKSKNGVKGGKKPLNSSGIMFATVSYKAERKK